MERSVSVPWSMPTSPLAEKLYGSSGPELRRSLFSLKQIFQVRPRSGLGLESQPETHPRSTFNCPQWCPQEDKDLVPEFVHSEGLSCLIRVGAAADHNYQSYILRGQAHPLRPQDLCPQPPFPNFSCPCVSSTGPADALCGWDAGSGGPQ